MNIALCKSIHGKWNYCPVEAMRFLKNEMHYGIDGYDTIEQARAAIRQDYSIPRNALIIEYPTDET